MRVRDCSSSSSTGSGRSGWGSHSLCSVRGTSRRAAAPTDSRSETPGCGTGAGGACGLNGFVEGFQLRNRQADILEADMPHAKIQRRLQMRRRIRKTKRTRWNRRCRLRPKTR